MLAIFVMLGLFTARVLFPLQLIFNSSFNIYHSDIKRIAIRQDNEIRMKMTHQNKPMPLKDLPEYIRSIRENGQTDYVPVVDVGRIITDEPSSGWFGRFAYVSAICLFLIAGTITYGISASKNITVTGSRDIDSQAIAKIVSEGGGRAVFVNKNDEGEYEVRVFALRGMSSLIENLRKNKDLKRVELND